MDRRIAAVVVLASGLALAFAFSLGVEETGHRPYAPADGIATQASPSRSEAVAEARPLSPQCKVESAPFEGRAPLRSMRRAILEKRPARVVSFGASSVVAADASSPTAAYPTRLERDLEYAVQGLEVEMFVRGQAGAVADDAAERLKAEVAALRPDLLVWQVGTNDAVARIDVEDFADRLRKTLSWLAAHEIDVVLIDPQYVERLSGDAGYTGIVGQVAAVASEKRVLRVNRYEAMADLARAHPGWSGLASDRFRLADMGYRCAAEYTAGAVAAGIRAAAAESDRKP